MTLPLVLDLDSSLGALTEAQRLDCLAWQDAVRFGCGHATWQAFAAFLDAHLPADYGTVLMGSGDFHHLSALLLARQRLATPFDVVVFDNHPDNMRFPFGIHCGSWVKHAACLPQIATVHVAGITSGDVGAAHAWENHLRPLWAGRVRYWTMDVDTRWARYLGLTQQIRSFANPQDLLEQLQASLAQSRRAVYLSIDKDVLDPQDAHTNWDQGRMRLRDITTFIDSLKGRIFASDITGEISIHHYQQRWKRWLSALDAQPEIAATALADWQRQQHAVNLELLAHLAAAR